MRTVILQVFAAILRWIGCGEAGVFDFIHRDGAIKCPTHIPAERGVGRRSGGQRGGISFGCELIRDGGGIGLASESGGDGVCIGFSRQSRA